jgi:hypothetical protein
MLGSFQIAMDVETAGAVETLRSDIHQVEREVVRVETSLTAKIEQAETSLTAKMHELNDDAKRHSDVQFESVRDDIRILAEGFATLSARIDSRR